MAVQNDPTLEVMPHRPRKDPPLNLATFSDEIFRHVSVADDLDFLSPFLRHERNRERPQRTAQTPVPIKTGGRALKMISTQSTRTDAAIRRDSTAAGAKPRSL